MHSDNLELYLVKLNSSQTSKRTSNRKYTGCCAHWACPPLTCCMRLPMFCIGYQHRDTSMFWISRQSYFLMLHCPAMLGIPDKSQEACSCMMNSSSCLGLLQYWARGLFASPLLSWYTPSPGPQGVAASGVFSVIALVISFLDWPTRRLSGGGILSKAHFQHSLS